MEQLLKACELGDITAGSGRVVEVQGKHIALFNIGGTFHAIDNAWPHRGGQLGEGNLDGTALNCPLHRWQLAATRWACTNQAWGIEKTPSVHTHGEPLR